MSSFSQRSLLDSLRIFTSPDSQAFIFANTAPDSLNPKQTNPELCGHQNTTAAEAPSATSRLKWTAMVNVQDPSYSMSRLAMNAAPCLRCLFLMQDGDPTRLCLNYIWKDNGVKGCVECMYDGKGGDCTVPEAICAQLRLARHHALRALFGAIRKPAEVLEAQQRLLRVTSTYMNLVWQLADVDVLYSIHRSHECERLARMRKIKGQADEKARRKGKKPERHGDDGTDSGEGAAEKSDGNESAATTELPVGDVYPRGFGFQLAHFVLLRKVWKQNQTILSRLENQVLCLNAIMVLSQAQRPPPMACENEEIGKWVKQSCEVLEKLLAKFDIKNHGLDVPDKLKEVAMDL
ncbi:hypothetical protein M440DRAFT_1357988 [Trichoderma longibrachiatum ATCC 18648]|uniref:Uncharacterized protein n=1 Tax=Trichoderma longibrachiatum ATCC 18648 TaxID=983965 RepID=A0A2T4C0V2_TRILO|nr:hypothetical protein M440DRAFT_1357988 [Trichoderma longibrachiatum ATCC 18648]